MSPIRAPSSRLVLSVALACLAVVGPGAALAAGSGVANSMGSGRDEASACHDAKRIASFAINTQLQSQGIRAQTRITSYGQCQCSRRPDVESNPAYEMIAWNCNVDVHYEILDE